MPLFIRVNLAPACLAFVMLCGLPVAGQNTEECVFSDAADTPVRQIISCGDGLVIEREPGAALRIFERSGSPVPRMIELEGGAIFIEVTPGTEPTRIRTPHAIAAVRGTTYVVDAGTAQTSVFVLEGDVDVQQADGSLSVELSAGEGVDAGPNSPLVARMWSEDRVDNLLGRFGR
ncbi:MAG: FecR family protein [Pseudomonadota bacterium]